MKDDNDFEEKKLLTDLLDIVPRPNENLLFSPYDTRFSKSFLNKNRIDSIQKYLFKQIGENEQQYQIENEISNFLTENDFKEFKNSDSIPYSLGTYHKKKSKSKYEINIKNKTQSSEKKNAFDIHLKYKTKNSK